MVPVVLAVRDTLCRHGLRGVLEATGALHVVRLAEQVTDVPTALAEHAPCLLLLDLGFQLDEPGLVPHLTATWPDVRVLLFSSEEMPGPDPRYVMALKAGAAGCVSRRLPVEDLRAAVLRAAEGVGRRARATLLTRREREIAAAVAEGLDNRGIADRLGLREQTVKNHVSRIMAKLGTHSRVQLARWALEQGPYSP